MMRYNKYIICIIIFISFQQVQAGTVRYVSIGFKGLKYISKDEIIRRAGIKSDGKNILVDNDRLISVLKNTALVKKYSLKADKDSLVIFVTEREPVIILALESKKETVLCELDDSLTVVSYNRIYNTSLPVLHLMTEKSGEFEPEGGVTQFCAMMMKIKEKHEALFAEIKDIEYSNYESIVHLYGRNTRFIVGNSMDNYIRFQYIAGYLDRIKHYPETVHIFGEKVLIK